MKKLLSVSVAAVAVCLPLGAFPLEWNKFQETGVPYEVEISRSKLEKLADVNKDCGFEVTAVTADGRKKLDVTLLEGRKKGIL